MPDHDDLDHPDQRAARVARLQRVVYGADADDEDRAAAWAELAALRADAAGTPAADGAAEPNDAPDRTDGQDMPATDAVPGPRRGRAAAGLAVLAGTLAIAMGFGAGWASASMSSTSDAADDDVVPLAAASAGVAVPVDESRAADVFLREPTEAELAVDPMLFSYVDVVPRSPRLLVTRSDGVDVWVARTVAGDVCLSIRIDAVSSGGGCTMDGMFPAEGVGVETFVQSRGYYAAWLEPGGDLRIRVDGVGASPGG